MTGPEPRIPPSLVARTRTVAEPRWAPGGARVGWIEAFAGRADLVVAPSDGTAPAVVTAALGTAPISSYGGGVWAWVDDETVVYGAVDGRLAVVPVRGGAPRTITREGDGRAAGPAPGPAGRVAAAFDRGDVHAVGEAYLDASAWPQRWSSADFAWDPAWSPDGRYLAWCEWDLPAMPWNASRIVVVDREEGRPRTVAGGDGIAVGQPRFSPDGARLAFTSDEHGWANVWIASCDGTNARPLLGDDPHDHAEPSWSAGQRSFAWSPEGDSIALCRNDGGFATLVVASVEPGAEPHVVGKGWHHGIDWGAHGIACVRSGARTPPQVTVVDPAHGARRVLARGAPAGFEAGGLVEPEAVRWEGTDGVTVHGLLYRPAFSALGDGPPPMLVDVHGGPTGQATVKWDPYAAYFVDRGWAVLRPNYRGSTGYGRAYMEALHGRWGELDVEDTAAGIRAAAREGWCASGRVAIAGGSAGGLTALMVAALHGDHVRAVVSAFGVTDLFDLAETTHRFESRYLDSLVGELPRDADRYRDHSPVAHAPSISAPLLVLQGDADKVVPPAQAQVLADAVRDAGGIVEHHVYAGEGHGWSKPETIEDELHRMERFLTRWVLQR